MLTLKLSVFATLAVAFNPFCVDDKEWKDSWGWSCREYQRAPEKCSDEYSLSSGGIRAAEACCACQDWDGVLNIPVRRRQNRGNSNAARLAEANEFKCQQCGSRNTDCGNTCTSRLTQCQSSCNNELESCQRQYCEVSAVVDAFEREFDPERMNNNNRNSTSTNTIAPWIIVIVVLASLLCCCLTFFVICLLCRPQESNNQAVRIASACQLPAVAVPQPAPCDSGCDAGCDSGCDTGCGQDRVVYNEPPCGSPLMGGYNGYAPVVQGY